jgi:hypothetical protein
VHSTVQCTRCCRWIQPTLVSKSTNQIDEKWHVKFITELWSIFWFGAKISSSAIRTKGKYLVRKIFAFIGVSILAFDTMFSYTTEGSFCCHLISWIVFYHECLFVFCVMLFMYINHCYEFHVDSARRYSVQGSVQKLLLPIVVTLARIRTLNQFCTNIVM